MKAKSDKEIIQFEDWCRKTIESLKGVRRWSFKPEASEENVLEHMFKTALLVWKLLSYEMLAGNPHNLSRADILFCAITHDIGEGCTGVDHPAPTKIRQNEEDENHAFHRHVKAGLPEEIQNFFPLPIDQDEDIDEVHKLFWKATEKLGYVYFALAELQDEEKTGFSNLRRVANFFHVAKYEKDSIMQLEKKFFSVRKLATAIYEENERLESAFATTNQTLPSPDR